MSLAATIEKVLGLDGTAGTVWHVDQRRHGPFAPLVYAAETPLGVHLVSSPLTQTEWWQTFLPQTLCPRHGGALGIPDAYEPYCRQGRCTEACQAEDGFVELRANRFRLAEDGDIVERRFPLLHQFLQRAESIVAAHDRQRGMGWELVRHYPLPCLQVQVGWEHLENHLSGLGDLHTILTGVLPGMSVEVMPPFDISLLDLESETGLMALAQHYALLEMLRRRAEFLFADLVAERGGSHQDGEFKLSSGLRYVVTTHVECFQGDTGYMGRLDFTGGLAEIRRFIATTLGGGRW